MKLSQFKFDLPESLIAHTPTENRDESRMMVVHRDTGKIEHRIFKDILEYFDEGDVMVVNDTKVFPARLYGNKEKTGAKIEVFLLRELNAEQRLWDVLVDPARKIRIGNKLYFGDSDELVAEVIDNTTSRGRTIRFLWDGTDEEFRQMLEEQIVADPTIGDVGDTQALIDGLLTSFDVVAWVIVALLVLSTIFALFAVARLGHNRKPKAARRGHRPHRPPEGRAHHGRRLRRLGAGAPAHRSRMGICGKSHDRNPIFG